MKNFFRIIAVFVGIFIVSLVAVGFMFRNDIALATRYATDTDEKTYLILLQNSLELRATGGFIGNFIELTLRGTEVVDYTVYNTNEFDFGKDGLEAPEPFQDMLNVDVLQLRDANWSPDFPTTADTVKELYEIQGGEKDVDGVIGITAEILPRLIDLTGPVYLDGFDEAIDADEALLTIQYDTNFGFLERGLEREERKESIVQLSEVLMQRIERATYIEKMEIAGLVFDMARENHIKIALDDVEAQKRVVDLGFDGAIEDVEGDYLFVVDSNMGALKTDYYMERAVTQTVEPCDKGTCTTIEITYTNTALEATPLNNDYRSYTRVYLAKDAFVEMVDGNEDDTEVSYTIEFDKKVAGFEVIVPFNGSRTVTLEYFTPERDNYSLFVQKQPGVEEVDMTLKVDQAEVSEVIRTNKQYTF